ncbi:MFS transporter [Microbispora siamensis]|uniref:MFS transporter n=1 Tax=Microbispora siamensis TaxID=564413 RepID=A0ABQ4GPD4_9ACTN|nr:MFS transporter [Microbispora siamensis]GIH63267.1 MFS transporter [Microbispora siamensis]
MTIISTGARSPRADTARPGSVLAAMSSCVIMAVSLVAAVNLAVPKLTAGSLHPSPSQLLWIVDSYVLVFACLLISAGAAGDRFGRRRVLLAGLAVYTAGCVVAALAPAVPVLVAGRVVTGVGAALVMPATLSMSLQAAPPERRAHTIAVWTAATGAAGIVGNLAGGLVLQYLPWQGLFWVMAPVALALLALAARVAPRHGAPSAAGGAAGRLDPAGSALLVLAFAALLTGIIEGQERGWRDALVLGAFVLAVVAFACFAWYALRAAHPVIDPRVFASRAVAAGVLGVTVTFFGLFALFFVNAQYLQYAKGFSPLVTGVAVGPLAVGMLVVSRISPALVRRHGSRPVVAAGAALLVLGLWLLSYADAAMPYAVYAVVLVAMAAGMGLSLPALSTSILNGLPAASAGAGSGLNGAAREVGSAFGVAVFGTLLAGRMAAYAPGRSLRSLAEQGTDARLVAAFTHAASDGFRVVAVVVAVLAVVVVSLYPSSGGRLSGR